MFSDLKEDSIVERAKKGDQLAVNHLIKNNMDIVYSKARFYFIRGMDREDVIQEGRVGLYKAIRDYKSERKSSFRGFCQLCVHRQLVSAIKRGNRKKHIPLNNYTSLDKKINFDSKNGRSYREIIPDKSTDLEKKLLLREMIDLLSDDLRNMLTELERNVFLKFLISKSYREVSSELNINVKTVDNALQRARKKLEKIQLNYDFSILVS